MERNFAGHFVPFFSTSHTDIFVNQSEASTSELISSLSAYNVNEASLHQVNIQE